MPILLWDASALVKRYTPETGFDTVNALLNSVPRPQTLVTFWGYAETYAILVRKRNRGEITNPDFHQALSALYREVIAANEFDLLSIQDATIMNGVPYILAHNLNSTDAIILAAYLEYAANLPSESPACVLVASDLRLLRAAAAEGLHTLNPELLSATDVPAFLATFP